MRTPLGSPSSFFRFFLALFARSLLALLEECNPDASNDRGAYDGKGLERAEAGVCKSDTFVVSETDSKQIEKASPFYPGRWGTESQCERPAPGYQRRPHRR